MYRASGKLKGWGAVGEAALPLLASEFLVSRILPYKTRIVQCVHLRQSTTALMHLCINCLPSPAFKISGSASLIIGLLLQNMLDTSLLTFLLH